MLSRIGWPRVKREFGSWNSRAIVLLFGAIALLLPLGAAGTAIAAADATLTVAASSVPDGGAITFTYTAPSSVASPYNVVAVIPEDQPQFASSVTQYESATGTSGSVTFITSSIGGIGTYYAYLANDQTSDIYAGPVAFTVTKGTVRKAPAYDTSVGQRVLDDPSGVAVDSGGDVWASDTGHNAIAEFTASGDLVKEIGQGRLDHPEGIAIGSSGDVWAAEAGSDTVAEFSASGALLTSFGGKGSGKGELDNPDAVAVSGGTVYIADSGNGRIEEFTTSGTYAGSISVPAPTGVAVAPSGDIWVASTSDTYGNGVYEYSRSGTRLLALAATQSGYGSFGDTGGIAIGADGNVYVAQPDYGLVSVLTKGGSFVTEFGLRSSSSAAGENLQFPQAVAVTSNGHVWVADSGASRLAEFGPATANVGAAAVAPVAGGGSRTPWIIALSVLAAALLAAAGLWLLVLARRRAGGPVGVPSPEGSVPAGQAVATASPQRACPARQAVATATAPAVVSRRTLLAGATALSGVAAAGVLPASLRSAIATTQAHPGGSLADIRHIVILMQESRSFDHYFGTMPGVRGFQDPAASILPDGQSVFCQPDPSHADGYLTPFHYDTKTTAAQLAPSLSNGWETQHGAWNGGVMDQWIPAKTEYTMGYYKEDDIPFHWALARAFTVCDNYYSSVLGATDPNRLYMWTGMVDPNGTGGGPVIQNGGMPTSPYTWVTYPERLQAAGISWQVYQEEDNYDDNVLEWFQAYQQAPTSSPLWQRGMQKRPAGWFEADARAGRLPQVSWLVAPSAQSEHPDYMPAAGAEYIAAKLDAIASNEDLWRSTLFILTYSDNNGYFEHVVPPTPSSDTADENVGGLPIGLGFRVPTILVSPWSAGGNVYSGALDHTSLIRILEARFGVMEPNISAWRRATCGDLTGALRFSGRPAGWPQGNQAITLAAAEAGLLTAQAQAFSNPRPAIPAVNEPIPRQ
jgi:phospholipase C